MATLTISWNAASGSTGSYRVKYWNITTPSNVIVFESVIGTSKTITGLDSGSTYSGTVEALCATGGYTTPITFTASVIASGGGGSEGLTTAINGSTSANCSTGVSGTITINSADTRKVKLTTFYYSGSGPWTGSTLGITNATTGDAVLTMNSPATALYQQAATTSTVTLGPGTYNYSLSPVPCFNGSGTTTIALVTP